jgi:hypothetical protein
MTFDLVRLGWPNTIPILALAIMPIISLALPVEPQRVTLVIESVEIGTLYAMLAVPPSDAEQ